MAECKDCIHYCVCSPYTAPNESYPEVDGCKCFRATADVVPKSEVERLEHILNSYALQYGTVKDQHEVIDKAKSEVAKEIFEEIEKWLVHEYVPYIRGYSNSLARNFAELKKKYVESENGWANSEM